MSAILLVRHGEAVGDDGADPGLSARGREQSLALADRLVDEGVETVWHGPKRRAAETAALLAAALRVEHRVTDLLDDRTPVPSAETRGAYTARALEWLAGVPAAERDVEAVVLTEAWRELRAHSGTAPVVMVTHAFVIAQFVSLAIEAGPSSWMRLPVANAGLTIIESSPNGTTTLRAFNLT